MIYCSNCGAQLDDSAKFCNNCGAPQEVAPVAAPVEAPVAPAEVEVTEKEIDNFVTSIKSLALLKQNSIAYEKAKLFITSNNLSEQSAKVVNSVVTELIGNESLEKIKKFFSKICVYMTMTSISTWIYAVKEINSSVYCF